MAFLEWLLGELFKKQHKTKTSMAAQLHTSGTMSFAHMRPRWRCLAIMHTAKFGENQTQHIGTNTAYLLPSTGVEGDDLGLFCS